MKKIVSLLVLISIVLISTMVCAAEGTIGVSVTAPQEIEEGTKTLVMTVSLQNFQDVAEGRSLGFQATLVYSEEIFESVAVEGLNGWDVNYEESSKMVTGLTSNSKANVDIARFTFTLKDDITAGSTDNILLNSFILSNDDNVNQQENYSVQVSVVAPTTPEEPENPDEGNNTTTNNTTGGNTVGNTNTTNTTNSANSARDNTIKSANSLPKAGVSSTLIICLAVIFVAGLIFIIRSKTIKLK